VSLPGPAISRLRFLEWHFCDIVQYLKSETSATAVLPHLMEGICAAFPTESLFVSVR
jgi:hypothetical protein